MALKENLISIAKNLCDKILVGKSLFNKYISKILSPQKNLIAFVIVFFAAALSWQAIPDYRTDHRFYLPKLSSEQISNTLPVLKSSFISDTTQNFVHAASMTELPDGRLLAAWLNGSREGGGDVVISGANYDPKADVWGENFELISIAKVQQHLDRNVRKLGNPVLTTLPNGRVVMYYVSVAVGGWAGSSINTVYSDDSGVTWSPTKKIITSPFFNISTLVKGNPVLYSDGSIGLPVYHEFIGKFAEFLRLTSDGKLIEKTRLTYGNHSLQPVVVPINQTEATALMRYAGKGERRMLITKTRDSGRSWKAERKTTIPNPNSALTALRLDDGSLISVVNDLNRYRYRLSLYRSTDEGESWQKLHMFDNSENHQVEPLCADNSNRCSNGFNWPQFSRETYTPLLKADFLASVGENRQHLVDEYLGHMDARVCRGSRCRFQYDYPYLIQSSQGDFHLLYSWNKSFIKHVQFNRAWLESLI